jgi:hypothetical protein
MPKVTVNSYDAQWPQPVKDLLMQVNGKLDGGTVYVGEKGVMVTGTSGDNPRILPQDKHAAFPKPTPTIPRSKHGMMGDFLAACKGGAPASSNFSVAGPFTEFVLTGVLASRAGAGEKFEWDVAKLACTNLPDVNRWVRREYRKGWEV